MLAVRVGNRIQQGGRRMLTVKINAASIRQHVHFSHRASQPIVCMALMQKPKGHTSGQGLELLWDP